MKTHFLTQDQFAEYSVHTGCNVSKGPFFTRPKAHSIGDTVVPEGTPYFLVAKNNSVAWDIVFIVAATAEQQTAHVFDANWLSAFNHLDPNGILQAAATRNEMAPVGHKQTDAGFYDSDPAVARRPSRVYATHKRAKDGYPQYYEGVECFSYHWEQVGEMLTTGAPIMKLTVVDAYNAKPMRSCIFDAGKQSF